jgi:branched-chain amino acid transport system permease protein
MLLYRVINKIDPVARAAGTSGKRLREAHERRATLGCCTAGYGQTLIDDEPAHASATAGLFGNGRFTFGQGPMVTFIQQLINGLTLGAVYGLIAIGYTMVYGIIGMINFAHGDIYMIGAFQSLIVILVLGFFGITWVPLALVFVLVFAVSLTALYGWAVERVAYRPLRGSTRLAPLISAIGMSIFLSNSVLLLQGPRGKPLPEVTENQFTAPFQLMTEDGISAQITDKQIMIMLVTVLVMVGFTLLIKRTSLGRQQRACEQDMKMASLLGVNINRTISLTFVMGAALACVAGLMVTLYYENIKFNIGFVAGIKAFSAAVVGGVGSLPGAMLGGMLIGLIEVFFSAYFSVDYKDVAAFGVLVTVLIFRPTGLLGRPEVEKV